MSSKLKAELIRIDDNGIDDYGTPQSVIIGETTQLGRLGYLDIETPGYNWWMRRRMKIQLAAKINDPKNFLSANHAVIEPPNEDHKSFTIYDLGSTNGTYVDGIKVSTVPAGISSIFSKRRGYPLSNGEIISLGAHLTSEGTIDQTGVQFRFGLLDPSKNPNYGLMVGHFGGNLRGTTNDVHALKYELEKRGFQGNIETLFNINANRRKILTSLNKLARHSTKDSTFLFYFSGHGNRKGELCLWGEKINSEELFEALEGVRGRLLLILDGCYTDEIARHGIPSNCDLIAHEGRAYEGVMPTVIFSPEFQNDGIDDDFVRGYTTHTLTKILKRNPNAQSVSDIARLAQQEPRIVRRGQKIVHRKNHKPGHTVVFESIQK